MTAPASLVPPAPAVRVSPMRPARLPLVAAVMAFAPVAVLNVIWFTSLPGGTMMGDDLELLLQSRTPGGYASGFFESFTQVGSDKYRPVVTVVLSVLTDLFGGSFTAYRNVNLALQLFNVALVGLLAWRLSRRSWLVAVAAMTLVTVSRFNVYFVLQVYGLMEGMAVGLLLCMLLALHRFHETGRLRALVAANAFYFLAVFTHERFIVLGGFLAVATVVMPALGPSVRRRLAWAAVPVGIASFNFVVKSWILGIDFLTGPGGQDVEAGLGQPLVFMKRAVMNILGFNTGPDYLAGRNMHGLGPIGVWLGIAFLLPVCALGLLVAGRWARAGCGVRRASRSWLLGASLLLPLLLSASITFRQEFRWLYAPYVALVAGICWALGRLSGRARLRSLATVAVLLGGLAVDGYYRRHVENTYFFAGFRTVDSIRAEILQRHEAQLSSFTVFLVTHGDPVVEGWYLRDGGFFRVYGPRNADIRLIPSLDAADGARGVRPKVLAFEIRAGMVHNVTARLPAGAGGSRRADV